MAAVARSVPGDPNRNCAAAGALPLTLTVTIEHVGECCGGSIDELTEADFYGRIFSNGVATNFGVFEQNDNVIQPNWVATAVVDHTDIFADVAIEVFDEDASSTSATTRSTSRCSMDAPGATPAHLTCRSGCKTPLVTATGPLFAVVNQPVTLDVGSAVTNIGPDTADITVTRTVTGPPGVSISPSTARTSILAGVATGANRSIADSWSVTCQDGGVKPLTITTSVAPTRAKVVDNQPTNNSRSTTFNMDCAVPVTVNIQPGSTRNPVNLTGSVLPVAVLSTSAGEYGNPAAFDATQIDPTTLRFASQARLLQGAGVPETHGAIHGEDSLELNELLRDGDLDAVTHYRPRSDALQSSDTQGCVFGRSGPGSVAFFGCDRVTVIR